MNEDLTRFPMRVETDKGNIIYLGPGCTYIEHVEHYHTDNSQHPTQVNIKTEEAGPIQSEVAVAESLPKILATNEALKYWSRLQRAGIVDNCFQPLCSRAEMALVAYEMAKHLAIENMWKIFGNFWQKSYLSSDYQKAQKLQKRDEYLEMLRKEIFY